MRVIQHVGDRLLRRLVPRTEASGLWIWETWCESDPQCSRDQVHWYPSKWTGYCHDSSGYCTNVSFQGCCS